MLKDRRHILLKDNQYSNTLVEPIEITSLESLGISITKGETVGLFPGFIVRDYSIDTEHKKIRIFLKSIESERHSCPLCSGKKVHVHAYRDVWYKDSPIGDYKVEICITVTRYICYSCRYGFSDRPKIVHPYYRLTKRAYSYILNMLQSEDATVSKVSKLTGISWQTVKDIEKAALRKRFADVDTSQIRYIAMDGISIKKRHTYATLIIDAQTQVLLAAIEGRTQADIAPFFEMLQERGHAQNIKGATMDANAGFNTIVKQYCPNAVIVLDQFHVIQNYNNQVIDAERIKLQEDISKRAEELNLSVNKTPKQISMGLKWAVFTGYERLLKNNEIDHELKELVLNNQTLSKVCIMGDCLRRLWNKVRSKTQAAYSAVNWCKMAEESGIESLADFGRRFRSHLPDVIHASLTGLNTSILEGMNNRCKVIKRMAYGFRDMEYYFLKLFQAFSTARQSKLRLSGNFKI